MTTCFAIRSEDLIRIVAGKIGIDPALIEKDGIMHCLYGLQRLGYKFELKGGTSLFKGSSSSVLDEDGHYCFAVAL